MMTTLYRSFFKMTYLVLDTDLAWDKSDLDVCSGIAIIYGP